MKIDKGLLSLPSWMGTCCSILTFIILSAYTIQKADVLVNKHDVSLQAAQNDLFFTSEFVFDRAQGFNVAITFASFAEEGDLDDLDPAYGEFNFAINSWYFDESENAFKDAKESIAKHRCSREELGLEDPEKATFYPQHSENSAKEVAYYQNKFWCIDPEDSFIYGDYDSRKARQLQIQLRKCSGHDYCKSEDEILDYFSGKFLLMLTNQIRFKQDYYSKDAIVKESRVTWHKINT